MIRDSSPRCCNDLRVGICVSHLAISVAQTAPRSYLVVVARLQLQVHALLHDVDLPKTYVLLPTCGIARISAVSHAPKRQTRHMRSEKWLQEPDERPVQPASLQPTVRIQSRLSSSRT